MKRLDLVGHRFERLLVFALKEINKKGNTVWECRCDCGASVVATGTDLKTNRKRSCGCLKSELLSEFRKLPPGEAGANSLYAQYRKSAHYRSIGFSLTITEFKLLIDKNCHYCGAGPALKTFSDNRMNRDNVNGNFIYTGIDRKNSDLGYVADNCVTCCKTCNFAKNDMSYEEFINYLNRLVSFRKVS